MKVKNSQRGFTLIELLVVMAVGGVLLSGIVIAIFQTFGVTKASTTQITALENIKNTAYRVSQDVRMAKTTNLGATPVNNLTLDWISWLDSGGDLPEIYYRTKYTYTLSGGKIQRQYGKWVPPLPTNTAAYNAYIPFRPDWLRNPSLVNPSLVVPGSDFTWQATQTVSKYISAIQFSSIPAPIQGNFIIMTITSSPEGRAETAEKMTYRMYLQPKEVPVQ